MNKLLLVVLLMASAGCVETIQMDTHHADLPVAVYCVLTEHPVQTLDLRYVKGISDEEYAPVVGAEPQLLRVRKNKKGESTYTEVAALFVRKSDYVWEADYAAEPSTDYELYIPIAGRSPIKAQTSMPDDFELVVYGYEDERLGYVDSYEFHSPGHYWVYASNKYISYVDVLSYTRENRSIRYDASLFTPFCAYLTTDNIMADAFNLTQWSSRELLDIVGYPDDDPTRVSATASIFINNYPNLPVYSGFIRMDIPADFSNVRLGEKMKTGMHSEKSFLLCASQNCIDAIRFVPTYYVRSLSEEYDRYLREVYVSIGRLDNNLTEVYKTKNVVTNIEGGVGIFGAVVARPYQIAEI